SGGLERNPRPGRSDCKSVLKNKSALKKPESYCEHPISALLGKNGPARKAADNNAEEFPISLGFADRCGPDPRGHRAPGRNPHCQGEGCSQRGRHLFSAQSVRRGV